MMLLPYLSTTVVIHWMHLFVQVEMCLLGYTFGIVLQVFRLYQYGQCDFSAYYPEEDDPKLKIPMVAEDDRHYNTVIYSDTEMCAM